MFFLDTNSARVFFLSGFLLSATAGFAQTVKPDHVLQVTETVIQELQALNEENFTQASSVARPTTPAMPRHVLFLARDRWRKVQLLRFMNGLETHGLDDVVVHQITPGEVKALVDQLLRETRELRPAYGLAKSDLDAAMTSGKKPVDVYGSLIQVSAELQSLGVPATVPNDVYRVALTVSHSLEQIAEKQGVKVDLSGLEPEQGRTPVDAYRGALGLLQDLQTLTTDHNTYTVPGGVAIPDEKSKGISPDDVILVLSRALADVMAIMHVTQTASALTYAPYVGGKTPSDVYYEIKRAQHIISSLNDKAA